MNFETTPNKIEIARGEAHARQNHRTRLSAIFAAMLSLAATTPVSSNEQVPDPDAARILATLYLDQYTANGISFTVPRSGTTGKYLLQIPQLHKTSTIDQINENDLRLTIENQKAIAELYQHLIVSNVTVTFCPEGLASDLAIAHEQKAFDDLKLFVDDITESLVEGDITFLQKQLDQWKKWNDDIYEEGSVYSYILYLMGVQSIINVYTDTFSLENQSEEVRNFLSQLQAKNPFGNDIVYYLGALPALIYTNNIEPSAIIVCEDEESFSKVGKMLTDDSARDDRWVERFIALNEEREAAIVYNVSKRFTDKNPPEIVMVSIGALHNLTNHTNNPAYEFGHIIAHFPAVEDFLESHNKDSQDSIK